VCESTFAHSLSSKNKGDSMGTQLDLDTLEIGGIPQLWIFVDEWGTDKSIHKDGDLFYVRGLAKQKSESGNEFPVVELTNYTGSGIDEDFRLTAWALKSKEKIKASDLTDSWITLEKSGTRLLFKVLTDEEVSVLKGQKQIEAKTGVKESSSPQQITNGFFLKCSFLRSW